MIIFITLLSLKEFIFKQYKLLTNLYSILDWSGRDHLFFTYSLIGFFMHIIV